MQNVRFGPDVKLVIMCVNEKGEKTSLPLPERRIFAPSMAMLRASFPFVQAVAERNGVAFCGLSEEDAYGR